MSSDGLHVLALIKAVSPSPYSEPRSDVISGKKPGLPCPSCGPVGLRHKRMRMLLVLARRTSLVHRLGRTDRRETQHNDEGAANHGERMQILEQGVKKNERGERSGKDGEGLQRKRGFENGRQEWSGKRTMRDEAKHAQQGQKTAVLVLTTASETSFLDATVDAVVVCLSPRLVLEWSDELGDIGRVNCKVPGRGRRATSLHQYMQRVLF